MFFKKKKSEIFIVTLLKYFLIVIFKSIFNILKNKNFLKSSSKCIGIGIICFKKTFIKN